MKPSGDVTASTTEKNNSASFGRSPASVVALTGQEDHGVRLENPFLTGKERTCEGPPP